MAQVSRMGREERNERMIRNPEGNALGCTAAIFIGMPMRCSRGRLPRKSTECRIVGVS